jgi:hypothetical protein
LAIEAIEAIEVVEIVRVEVVVKLEEKVEKENRVEQVVGEAVEHILEQVVVVVVLVEDNYNLNSLELMNNFQLLNHLIFLQIQVNK